MMWKLVRVVYKDVCVLQCEGLMLMNHSGDTDELCKVLCRNNSTLRQRRGDCPFIPLHRNTQVQYPPCKQNQRCKAETEIFSCQTETNSRAVWRHKSSLFAAHLVSFFTVTTIFMLVFFLPNSKPLILIFLKSRKCKSFSERVTSWKENWKLQPLEVSKHESYSVCLLNV